MVAGLGSALILPAVTKVQLSEEIGLNVARRLQAIVRPRKLAAGYGLNQVRSHYDHEFGLVAKEVATAEQCAEDRHVANSRQTADNFVDLTLYQAAHHQRTARRHLKCRFRPAHV